MNNCSESKIEFNARLWIDSESSIERVEIWVGSLIDTDPKFRRPEEWIEEHLTECITPEELLDRFSLEPEYSYQIVFRGVLSGWMTMPYCEWDERLEILEFKSMVVSKTSWDCMFT